MKGIEKAYVVSDLHFGGAPSDGQSHGFQINTRGTDFAKFVDWIAGTGKRVELILNGDTIDFLAEASTKTPQWQAFTADPQEALHKLNAIMGRETAVFDALARFLAAGHRLVFILGNHDIELSFPLMRKRLRERLGADGKDFQFIDDDEPYKIGSVLIEHGNHFDDWNDVDYTGLQCYCDAQSRQEDTSGCFSPPPGSEMVATVINPIKKDYAFIDLLKPETETAVPLLLALKPDCLSLIKHVAWLAIKAKTHHILGATSADATKALSTDHHIAEEDALNNVLDRTLGDKADNFREQLGLSSTEMQDELPPGRRHVLAKGRPVLAKGMWSEVASLAELISNDDDEGIDERLPVLLDALRAFQGDENVFQPDVETSTEYLDAAEMLSYDGVQHVIFGHTHLAKKVALPDGGYYLNSGTWANVLQFPPEILSGPDSTALPRLKEFVEKMRTNDFSGYVTFRPNFVCIDLNSDGKVVNVQLRMYGDQKP